jgi:hypothetical protein
MFRRNIREVGLDIENRSAIEHIDSADVKAGALAAEQFDDRQAYRIRALGRAGCEYTVGPVIARWHANQLESFGTIKGPDHEQVRKAFDIREAKFEFRIDFENALRAMLCA